MIKLLGLNKEQWKAVLLFLAVPITGALVILALSLLK